jgi:hypothetical protein
VISFSINASQVVRFDLLQNNGRSDAHAQTQILSRGATNLYRLGDVRQAVWEKE